MKSLILLHFAATAALAQAPLSGQDPCATAPQTCATLIATHATAQSRIPNTAVDISVGITASGRDLSSFQRALAEKSSSLLAYLRAGKAERLITSSVSFSPSTKPQKNAPDKTVGYDASAQLSFRTTPDRAPELLAGVLEHGANSIESNTFTPTEDEVSAARAALSAEATRTAITQAEAIAKAAGLRVIAVRTISVEADATFEPRGRSFPMMAMKAMAAPAPPIETAAGGQSLSMRVDVTIAAAR